MASGAGTVPGDEHVPSGGFIRGLKIEAALPRAIAVRDEAAPGATARRVPGAASEGGRSAREARPTRSSLPARLLLGLGPRGPRSPGRPVLPVAASAGPGPGPPGPPLRPGRLAEAGPPGPGPATDACAVLGGRVLSRGPQPAEGGPWGSCPRGGGQGGGLPPGAQLPAPPRGPPALSPACPACPPACGVARARAPALGGQQSCDTRVPCHGPDLPQTAEESRGAPGRGALERRGSDLGDLCAPSSPALNPAAWCKAGLVPTQLPTPRVGAPASQPQVLTCQTANSIRLPSERCPHCSPTGPPERRGQQEGLEPRVSGPTPGSCPGPQDTAPADLRCGPTRVLPTPHPQPCRERTVGRPGPPAALTGARHPDQGRARAPTALQPGTLCHSAGDPPPPRPEPPRTAGSTESWGFQLLRRGPSAGIPFPLGLFGVYGSFTEGSRAANPRGRARPAGGAGNRRRERPRSGSRSPTGQSWEPALRPAAARDGSRRPALPPPAGPPGLLRAQLRPELWGRPASPLQEGPAPGPTGPCLAPPGPPTRGWPPSKAGLRAPAAPPLLRAGARGAGAGRPRDKHSRGSEETPSQRWPPGWQDGPAGPPAGVGGAPRLLRPPGLRSEPGRVRHHPWPREAELQPCCAGDTGQETPADGVAGQEVCRSEAGSS
ncbi:basic proline-rich protein-like [Canis lupus familiaris]|uniref:basic proline-rich protein-like n=1 Tax=Canis lupus familiaris TaxID=9615 RepID=UPI0018F56F97|nr:basic proline-rich protein-like [Canis lupus familiaris]